MADQVIFDTGGVVDKHEFTPWMVNDRGLISLMICRGHIKASKDAFQIFYG